MITSIKELDTTISPLQNGHVIPVFKAGLPQRIDASFFVSVTSPEGVKGVSTPMLVEYEETGSDTPMIANIYGRSLNSLPYKKKMEDNLHIILSSNRYDNMDASAAQLLLSKGLTFDAIYGAGKMSDTILELMHSMRQAMLVEQCDYIIYSYFPDDDNKDESLILSTLIGADERDIENISDDILGYTRLKSLIASQSFKKKSVNKQMTLLSDYNKHRDAIMTLGEDERVSNYIKQATENNVTYPPIPDWDNSDLTFSE